MDFLLYLFISLYISRKQITISPCDAAIVGMAFNLSIQLEIRGSSFGWDRRKHGFPLLSNNTVRKVPVGLF